VYTGENTGFKKNNWDATWCGRLLQHLGHYLLALR